MMLAVQRGGREDDTCKHEAGKREWKRGRVWEKGSDDGLANT